MSDWRAGELIRIRQLAERTIRCVDRLIDSLPVANPDPLDTMEMVFRDPSTLAVLLEEEWTRESINPGNAGNIQ